MQGPAELVARHSVRLSVGHSIIQPLPKILSKPNCACVKRGALKKIKSTEETHSGSSRKVFLESKAFLRWTRSLYQTFKDAKLTLRFLAGFPRRDTHGVLWKHFPWRLKSSHEICDNYVNFALIFLHLYGIRIWSCSCGCRCICICICVGNISTVCVYLRRLPLNIRICICSICRCICSASLGQPFNSCSHVCLFCSDFNAGASVSVKRRNAERLGESKKGKLLILGARCVGYSGMKCYGICGIGLSGPLIYTYIFFRFYWVPLNDKIHFNSFSY